MICPQSNTDYSELDYSKQQSNNDATSQPPGRFVMKVCYKKLWKLLIDKDLKKKDLCAKAGISPASVTKMGKNGHVTTDTLEKICIALDCQIGDILDILPE